MYKSSSNSSPQQNKDASYRQNLWLSFRNRKMEELYQADFSQRNKAFRIGLLLFTFFYLLNNLHQTFEYSDFSIFLAISLRIFIEKKTPPRNNLRLFLNGITLLIALFFMALETTKLQLDPLYFHAISLLLHAVFLPCLPLNIIIMPIFFILYINDFLFYIPIHFIIIYLLNKRSRDMFVWMDNLIKQQKTYSLMIENSPNAIFIIDMNHRIHFCNSQAKAVLKKSLKNFSEKSNPYLNFMMIFEEKYHEKLNQAIFECTLAHSTSRLYQIPIIIKPEVFVPLLEPEPNSSISPRNLSFSRSILKSDFINTEKTQKFNKPNHFFNISIQNTFWKGGHFFLLTLESQEEMNKLLVIGESCMNLISGSLIESIDLMEKDYQKWNNFQAIKVIKESDLKDLASIVIECNRIKGLVSSFKNINQLVLERTEKTPHKFNIRNTLVQCMELISIKAIEKKMELLLKFEESFPEHVYGEYEHFKQLMYCLLRIINISHLSSMKKPSKFTLFCKLNKLSEEGRFILNFSFEFEPNNNLENFFKEVSDTYNPKEPFNYDYLIKHSEWVIDQLALIPLMRILSADIMSQKLEEKSLFSIEMAFEASDQNLSSLEKSSNSHSSPSMSLLNKKPLQLSFCRISPNINNVIWKEKPQAALTVNKQIHSVVKKKQYPFHIDLTKTTMKTGLISQLEKDKENKEIKEKEAVRLENNVNNSIFHKNNANNIVNNLNITKGTPSFEFIKKEQEDSNGTFSCSPSWKSPDQNYLLSSPGRPPKLKIYSEKKPVFGGRKEQFFPQITERENENSKTSSLGDIKEPNGSLSKNVKTMNSEKNLLILGKSESSVFLPFQVTETLDAVKLRMEGEFERLLYMSLEDIIRKQCPERISYIHHVNKHMKRNHSDVQLFLNEKPCVDSPKSSLLHSKTHGKAVFSQSISSKKFSMKSNIIKSLMKFHKSSLGTEIEEILPKENMINMLEFELPNKIPWINDPIFKAKACFNCHLFTHKRGWMSKSRKKSFVFIDVLIIAKTKVLNGGEKKYDSTYLRSLLNRGFQEIKINVCFIDGYEQFEGYLNVKLNANQNFKYVFFEEDENFEEIQMGIQKYRQFELKKKEKEKSVLIILGKNETVLEKLRDQKDIRNIIKLQGNEEDWNKLTKIINCE